MTPKDALSEAERILSSPPEMLYTKEHLIEVLRGVVELAKAYPFDIRDLSYQITFNDDDASPCSSQPTEPTTADARADITPLEEDLIRARDIICDITSKRRTTKISIPVDSNDEDIFLCDVLGRAMEALRANATSPDAAASVPGTDTLSTVEAQWSYVDGGGMFVMPTMHDPYDAVTQDYARVPD
jgi:hypothetical protein